MLEEEYETHMSTKVGARNGATVKVVCPICKTKTNHTVRASVHQDWEVVGIITGAYDLLTIQCNGCENVQFCKESSDDDSWHEEVVDGINKQVYDVKREIFPLFNNDFKPVRHYNQIPKHVRNLYEETYDSLVSGNIYLSGAGVRAVIEAICIANGIKTGKLVSKINKLHSNGIVTEAMKDLLHSVRVFGNNSVHTDTPIEYLDLILAWDAIDYLMVSIYGTGSANSQYEWKKSGWTETESKPEKS